MLPLEADSYWKILCPKCGTPPQELVEEVSGNPQTSNSVLTTELEDKIVSTLLATCIESKLELKHKLPLWWLVICTRDIQVAGGGGTPLDLFRYSSWKSIYDLTSSMWTYMQLWHNCCVANSCPLIKLGPGQPAAPLWWVIVKHYKHRIALRWTSLGTGLGTCSQNT